MNRLGKQVRVVVDDRIALNESVLPLNARPNNRAWWGVLLEKAWCKMNVNCARLNAGSPFESFLDLTGMPVLKYWTPKMSDNQILKAIQEGSSKKWPMIASCKYSIQGLE